MSIFMSLPKISVCQYGRFMPRSHVTAPGGSSHLFPRLNLSNLPHPSFFQFVTPFSCPNSFCPVLSSHGGKLFFNFKAICLHDQRKRSCVLFACCRCHLSPQFQPLSGRHPNRTGSASPCWHHACTQQLLNTHFHVVFLESPYSC